MGCHFRIIGSLLYLRSLVTFFANQVLIPIFFMLVDFPEISVHIFCVIDHNYIIRMSSAVGSLSSDYDKVIFINRISCLQHVSASMQNSFPYKVF